MKSVRFGRQLFLFFGHRSGLNFASVFFSFFVCVCGEQRSILLVGLK